jgi:hypothetical protein
MLEFIKNILSSESDLSSKRLAGFICLFNAIALGYMTIPNESILDSFLLFAAGVWSLSVIDKFKK